MGLVGVVTVIEEDDDYRTAIMDPLVMRSRARVGTVLHSKYRLDVLLGVGGMAAVYACTHRNGSRAAVKLLHPELSLNAQVKTRFLREGYVANAVGHDGAVRVTDDDTAEDGSAFLVMELLDGETLEDRRERLGGKLSEDEVLSMADQLLDVLSAAHAKGVIHRDLKPENIFLTRAGQVKVLDFGIARLRELSTASTATKSGATMGTPYYMAPEQARGLWDEVDGRTDLWALGATMFHALTGTLVHDGRTTNEVLLAAMTKPAPSLGTVAPNISPTVTHLVDRALEFDREARWRDARHMQEAVRHAYHDRYGTPIGTAPKLIVPDSVPNRTLSAVTDVRALKLPTTGQPVMGTGPRLRTTFASLSSKQVAGVVFGGAVALGIVISGIAWIASGPRGTVAGAPSASAVSVAPIEATSTPPNPTAMPAPSASVVPVVAATDLPTAAAAATAPTTAPNPTPPATTASPLPAPVPTPITPPAPPATAAPIATTSKPNCNPPYTMINGRKHFKAECL